MKRVLALKRTLGQFSRTTTLHGFRYLWSKYKIDRLGWAVVCMASTCCGGVLCAVLWARFLEEPALLERQDVSPYDQPVDNMLTLAVCPPVSAALHHLNLSERMTNRLSEAISSVIIGRKAAEGQLETLEKLLLDQNTSVKDFLVEFSPSCTDVIVGCRWQSVNVPCEAVFERKLITGGVCCIMRAAKSYNNLSEYERPSSLYRHIRTIDLALHCSNQINNGCKFYAKYDEETNVPTMVLAPGNIYTAHMSFTSVPISFTEEFVESNCVTENGYSWDICQDKCAEKHCGCSDPFREKTEDEPGNRLPECSLKKLSCLRNYDQKDDATCDCLPSCNQVTSDISLYSSPMDLNIFAFDPIYNGLHSKSTVIHFQLSLPLSKLFSLNPTETWVTLLSSLGGVFNMFLGVGLFSALEILYLLLFKLPSIVSK